MSYLARSVYTATASQTDFSIGFEFLEDSDVLVEINDTATTAFTIVTGDTVRLDSGADEGDVVVIYRETDDEDRVVDFESGSTLTESDLDNDSLQAFYLIQEMKDNLGNVMRKNNAGTQWQGEGIKIANISEGSLPTDGVTLSQVQTLIAGGELAEISSYDTIYLDGDGATTDFELPDITNSSEDSLLVTVENVVQGPGSGYSYIVYNNGDASYPGASDEDDYIVFSAAPPTGTSNICVRHISGLVNVVLGSDVVTSGNIADDAVGLDNLDFAAGSAGRVIFIDAAGDPSLDTIVSADISDLGSTITGYTLSQFGTPTGNISMGGYQLTSVGTPTDTGHAANKAYVDGQVTAAVSDMEDYADSVAVGTRAKSWDVESGTIVDGSSASTTLSWVPRAIALTWIDDQSQTVSKTFVRNKALVAGTITISYSCEDLPEYGPTDTLDITWTNSTVEIENNLGASITSVYAMVFEDQS